MSKSRNKRYYSDDEDDHDRNKNRQRFEDRRKTKKLKQALKTQNLDYFQQDDV
jgi:hypothetical protein